MINTFNLSKLSDEALLQDTREVAQREREVTLIVLHHLREIERRSLFAILGYSSLFEYAVKELKYSEGSAQRRISSMRLLRLLPELEGKIEAGVLPLSTLSQAQSFFRHEKTASLDEKRKVLMGLEGKSSREVERDLASRSAEPLTLKPDSIRPVSKTLTELKFLVDDAFLQQLQELRELTAHTLPQAKLQELFDFAVKKLLEQIRPKPPKSLSPTPAANEELTTAMVDLAAGPDNAIVADGKVPHRTRYVPAEIKREVWARDGGQCTYVHEGSRRRCACRTGLELDHIQPFAQGGVTEASNLRLFCQAHNRPAAEQSFGREKMARFMPRMNS